MERVQTFNFAAGPSVLPTPVLEQAQRELLNYQGSGMSVMEMSHRSAGYQEIFADAKTRLKALMQVPDTHEILFLQGGGTLQFAMAPMNLMSRTGKADYAVTGNFSGIAAKEAEKYGTVRVAADTAPGGHRTIPTQPELSLSPDASYFYYCSNNTIYGTEWHYVPETGNVPLVCDMSSDILTYPVDVSRYGLIFAGAQKNLAPAGLTVAIIDKSLAGNPLPITPKVMDYQVMIDKDSMLNTPPCWCIYMLGLNLAWVEVQGGAPEMARRKKARAGALYEFLDNSRVFHAHAALKARSDMNVTFRTESDALDAEFVQGAAKRGLLNVKGHRLTGGMRASLYNAMPMEGVTALIDYMKEFEVEHR
ncbi:MAG: 3-phosphoserine/phosphohydroxythreonine transaminase [Oscillospiraceae bacterium]|jgi:phosphoserine aminotransferase|nr:3-phosphoserine/phosphohydroxythreonine transaminase [Oscillospiraceae bacterium]